MQAVIMSEPLLILGASARAAAGSARRAGFEPWAADRFGDVDLQVCSRWQMVARYPRGLAEAADRFPACGWLYTGALENHPRLVDRIAGQRPLLGNPGPRLRRVRDPFVLTRTLRAAGFPCPIVCEAATACGAGSWLRKPRRSSGGDRIIRFEAPAVSLPDATWGDESYPAAFYYQRFVDGTPCSGLYVAAAGRASLLGITQQLIGTPWTGTTGFRYAGSLGPLPVPDAVTDQFRALGNCVAAEFALSGLFGIDAILAEATVWPVEVNPRYTASVEVLERALGLAAIAHHVRACRTDICSPRPAGPRSAPAGHKGQTPATYSPRPGILRGEGPGVRGPSPLRPPSAAKPSSMPASPSRSPMISSAGWTASTPADSGRHSPMCPRPAPPSRAIIPW